nr:PREDICTED: B- and T-lymphocyte attenuator-like [Paralichthys olivaceus]
MTGGFTRDPIMRPHHWFSALHVSFWAALVLTLNAGGEESDCTPIINVRRNTAYEISLGQDLVINCTVEFCNKSAPTVLWYKLEENTAQHVNVSSSSHIKTEWKGVNHSEGVSFLKFQNILSSDSGLYRCRVGNDVGHSINVSVHGGAEHTSNNNTNSRTSDPEPLKHMWMYVYSAAGTVGFVTIVIVLTVSIRCCKGKQKKETQSENQHAAIPMVETHSPRGSLQPSPRASPSAPPACLSAPKDPQPDKLAEGSRDQVYSKVKEDRKRKRNAAEEGTSVVYAALNHRLPSGAAARPQRSQECSEYAAIRVM